MMNVIQRTIQEKILQRLLNYRKTIIIYGARQVGKTTMVREILAASGLKYLSINAEMAEYYDVLTTQSVDVLKSFTAGYDVLFIDEAQQITEIGLTLKLIYDHIPTLKVIVTGSSSLDLANRLQEPLTGRKWTYKLYPISYAEEKQHTGANDFEMQQRLNDTLLYGQYPELYSIDNIADKRQYLREITASYLYKDILMLADVKYSEKLRQLLKLIAYQIGNLVSIQELANGLQINRDTVINYIDLLEKSFVIFRLSGFNRNLRKEVTKMDKIYFVDLGIRNAVIENYGDIMLRPDRGGMWENYLIVERFKRNEYINHQTNTYFWRTYSGAELDYVEESEGRLKGYEFKWKSNKKGRSTTWIDTYDNATTQLINRDNYASFINE